MRTGAAVLIVALLGSLPAAAQTIGGRYAVDGVNPNGSHYAGTAEIIPLQGSSCRMTWQVGSTWNGVCLVTGHALGVVYQSGNASGLAVYDLQADGSLHGVWTLNDQLGSETLTPAK